MGPILFSVFVNDLVACCLHCNVYWYDVHIYLKRPLVLVENLVQWINYVLERVTLWSDFTDLKLKSSKTKAILIPHRGYDPCSLPCIRMVDKGIEFVTTVANLGFKPNSRLSGERHVKYTVMRILNILRKLCPSSPYVPILYVFSKRRYHRMSQFSLQI